MSKRVITVMEHWTIFWLTLKYFIQGDEWQFAKSYAKAMVLGFIKH